MINKYTPKRKYKRKKKPIWKSRLFWDFILVVVLIASISYFLFFSEIFKIKEIKVNLGKELLKEELQFFLRQKEGRNFFLTRAKDMEIWILEKYPKFEKVEIKKVFPNNLIIEIKERKQVGVFCFEQEETKESCFLIDKQGVIFEGPVSEDLVLISEQSEVLILGEKNPSGETITEILKINKQFLEKLEIDIEKFVLVDKERLDVKTSEGWEVYFDLSEDVDLALIKLNLLLEKEISFEQRKNLKYIDLRFSRAYYK